MTAINQLGYEVEFHEKSLIFRFDKGIDNSPKFDNSHSQAKVLQSNLSGMWRYHVGDFQLLCRIFDKEVVISFMEIGIYKSH